MELTNPTNLYHPPGAYKYVSFIGCDSVVDHSREVYGRSHKYEPKNNHSHRTADACQNRQILVKDFGYKNLYRVCVTNSSTQEKIHIDTTKNHFFLLWNGGSVELQNIRSGMLLVLEGGVRGVVMNVTYLGYRSVKEVISKDCVAFVVNGAVCVNKGLSVHKRPATSYGLIAFRMSAETGKIELLVVRRKHTMGFMDLLRGRYYNKNIDDIVRTYLSEITTHERETLMTRSFDQMWNDIWMNHRSKSYRTEYVKAKRKFEVLNIPELLKNIKTKYEVPEYGFPKGRKNKNENTENCARREFEEETGLTSKEYQMVHCAPSFEEKFLGTNDVQYRHVYYLAQVDYNIPPPRIDTHAKQYEEISAVDWKTVEECLILFRPYDSSKKRVAIDVEEYISASKK